MRGTSWLTMATLPLAFSASAQTPVTAPTTIVTNPTSGTTGAIADALPTDTVCMRRAITNNGGPPFTLQAMVPADKAQALAAKGYLPSKCGRATSFELASYRKMVCTMAIQGNEAVVNRNTEILGERPETLCENARAIEAKLGIVAPAATLADVPAAVPSVGTTAQTSSTAPG